MSNPARQALSRAVNRAIAEGAPVYTEIAPPSPATPAPNPFDLRAAEQFRDRLARLDERVTQELGEGMGRNILWLRKWVDELTPAQQRDLWAAMVEELAPPRWMVE